jgi:hypothetical protein
MPVVYKTEAVCQQMVLDSLADFNSDLQKTTEPCLAIPSRALCGVGGNGSASTFDLKSKAEPLSLGKEAVHDRLPTLANTPSTHAQFPISFVL